MPVEVAVVMGAGTPVGREVSLALAAEDALVWCADLRSAAAAATAAAIVAGGGRACSQSVDVTEPEELYALFERVVAEHGRVDVACNVATVCADSALLDLPAGSVERTVLACVRGAFFACQAAGRVMAARGCGTVVSVMGPAAGAGAVVNAAIAAIAATFSQELAAAGVTVHAVDAADAATTVVRLAAAGLGRQGPTPGATTPAR